MSDGTRNAGPRVGVAAILTFDGKVLLGKRKGAHGAGCWSFPGGHLQFGESWDECAIRETYEETGLPLREPRFAGVTNDFFRDEGRHYVTIFMTGSTDSGGVRLLEPDKCERWEWFEWGRLPTPLFLPIANLVAQGYELR